MPVLSNFFRAFFDNETIWEIGGQMSWDQCLSDTLCMSCLDQENVHILQIVESCYLELGYGVSCNIKTKVWSFHSGFLVELNCITGILCFFKLKWPVPLTSTQYEMIHLFCSVLCNYCIHMRWTTKIVNPRVAVFHEGFSPRKNNLSRVDILIFTSCEGNNCFIIQTLL